MVLRLSKVLNHCLCHRIYLHREDVSRTLHSLTDEPLIESASTHRPKPMSSRALDFALLVGSGCLNATILGPRLGKLCFGQHHGKALGVFEFGRCSHTSQERAIAKRAGDTNVAGVVSTCINT
jgi:hypothetical protein